MIFIFIRNLFLSLDLKLSLGWVSIPRPIAYKAIALGRTLPAELPRLIKSKTGCLFVLLRPIKRNVFTLDSISEAED